MLNKLIEIASGEVGVKETGENIVKYNDWYWGTGYRANGADYPWCVVFQAWCADKAGVPFPHVAHCNQVESYARTHEQWITGGYKRGDFVIFDYDHNGNRDHIGLVESVDGGKLITIEGNYADKVARVARKASDPVGAYRPEYRESVAEDTDEETECIANGTDASFPVLRIGDVGEAVGSLQSLLRYHGYRMQNSFVTISKPDCEFGKETEAALFDFAGVTETRFDVWAKLIGGLG